MDQQETPSSLANLAQGIIDDARTLLEQQFELLRTEVKEELQKVSGAAVSVGTGAGLVAVSGVLSTLMLVHLLNRTTRLPLWGCSGVVGGLMGAAGAQLLSAGLSEVKDVQLVPPRTAETLKKDVAVVKDRLAPA